MGSGGTFARAAAEKRVFHTLDGLRGVAAIAVVMLHYHSYVWPLQMKSAHLAVDLFFVMSGFVIAYAYEEKLRLGLGVGSFMLARFVRLYPLYILGTLMGVLVPLLGVMLGISRLYTWPALFAVAVPAMLMLPRPPNILVGSRTDPSGTDSLYPLNIPAWSLLFEVLANLAYAATLRFNQRIFMPLVIGIAAMLLVDESFRSGMLNGGWRWNDPWVGAIRVGYSFFLGVVLYRAYVAGKLPRLPFPPPLALCLVAVLLYWRPSEQWQGLYDLSLVLVGMPLLVWLCVCNEPAHGLRIYSALGLISYPIYVIHYPLQYAVDRVIDRLLHGSAAGYSPWIGLALIAGMVVLSWWLARTYDVSARQWLSRIVRRRGSGVARPALSD